MEYGKRLSSWIKHRLIFLTLMCTPIMRFVLSPSERFKFRSIRRDIRRDKRTRQLYSSISFLPEMTLSLYVLVLRTGWAGSLFVFHTVRFIQHIKAESVQCNFSAQGKSGEKQAGKKFRIAYGPCWWRLPRIYDDFKFTGVLQDKGKTIGRPMQPLRAPKGPPKIASQG